MLTASKLATKYAIVAGAAIMLPACASSVQKTTASAGIGNNDYREAIGVYSSSSGDEGMDPIAAAAFWGTRYNTDQSDPAVAVNFSRALRKIGSNEEAVGVMQKTAATHLDNADVNLEYGKVLVESGRAFEAVRYLETAVAKAPADWRALSAYGVALDQIGEHDEARAKYDRALGVAPGEVMLLNNKGLSYALDGNLSQARQTLRQAATNAGADSRIRQNLALVLALSGDMREAERLARSDLPPLVADNNIDVYRQLMNQPAYWDQYAAGDVDTPNFDDVPAAPLSPVAPSPKPQLQEEPKEDEEKADTSPVALMEVAPVTSASMPAEPAPVEGGIELKTDE
ncbi:tetratricopeptide repeat protein [Marinicaulis aureus]|uniref:Tetratricopeptide repeat protein n=1 Tax=Hyphococcus aureus TaxID=2666033 RepID=A0ABW1KRU8_9PROT